MKDLRTLVDELNQMILEGKILEAFDKFYGDDVVMQDNDYPQRVGKEVNRQYETDFVNGLTEFRGAKVITTIISDGIACVGIQPLDINERHLPGQDAQQHNDKGGHHGHASESDEQAIQMTDELTHGGLQAYAVRE